LPLDSRFLTAGPARVILFTPTTPTEVEAAPLRARGTEIYSAPSQAIAPPHAAMGRVDLVAALAKLHQLGIGRVLVEGGGTLNFALLRLALVDEVQVFVSPLIFGGASAPTLADGLGLPRDQAIPLQRLGVEPWPDGGVLLRYKVESRR
jgi:riboflavin biosynthesis pyrimidine reductase